MITPSAKIYLSNSKNPKAGRGVFAAKDIEAEEVIEVSPVVVTTTEDYRYLRETTLRNYYFMWGDEEPKKVAICLGYGSLFNHSYKPNATYKKRINDQVIEFIALQPIKKDEEISVNYNYGRPDDKTTLWMNDIDPYGE